jgi:integrase
MIDSPLVFKLADSIGARLRALVIVAGFVGLRTGELLGLRRCDVDLDNARLTVLVQAQQVVGQGRIVTGPKSEAGQRTVSLPTVVVEALEKHLVSYGQPGDAGVLFTGPRGEPITRALLSKEWQTARTAANAPKGQFHHPTKPGTVTVAGNLGAGLRPGTRASVLRQAGLKGPRR